MGIDSITILGIILNAVSAVTLLVTAMIMVAQTREMRQSTYASAFKAVYDMLQENDVRDARRIVLVTLTTKSIESWTEKERMAAEKVCYTYDTVGIMIRNGIVPVSPIADNWGDSLRRTWSILSPLVEKYREERHSYEYWDDYEWLAKQAEKYQRNFAKK